MADTWSDTRSAIGNTMRHAAHSVDGVPVNAHASRSITHMRAACTVSYVTMESSFKVMMTPERLCPVLRRAQHPPRLPGQSLDGCVRCYVSASRYLVSNVADGAPGDARHCAKQVPRLGVAVKRFRNRADTPRQFRRGPGQGAGDFGKSFLRHGRYRFGHHWQKLAGGHPDKRQEMFGCFIFCLCFSR